jgi:hypothetical protein
MRAFLSMYMSASLPKSGFCGAFTRLLGVPYICGAYLYFFFVAASFLVLLALARRE